MRRAEATHDRAGVEVALHVTPRGQRHGHGRQYHGQHRRQTEEFLRPVKRAADFGAGVFGVLDALATPQLFFGGGTEQRQRFRLTGQQQAIGDATPRLFQPRCGQIGKVHHQARCQADEVQPTIRLLTEHRRHSKA